MNISRKSIQKFSPLLVLLALVLVFTILNPNFLSLRNFARIAISASPGLMVALGVTFIILMGSIDLSMEGSVAVNAVLFAVIFLALDGNMLGYGWLALPLTCLIGLLLGFLNGLIHVKLRIPSFMSSLSVGFVGIGLSLLITGGDRIRIEDPVFRSLLTERLLGFPLMAYVALLGLMLGWFIQSKTAIGRNFYAIGGGESLAAASGLNVNRVRITGFMIAGFFYSLGALLAVGRIGIAETATGYNFMFISITSVVVGGTALWGGKGGVWSTLVGVLIVNVIANGMIVLGIPNYIQDGVLGLLVISAVYLSTERGTHIMVK